MGFPGRALRPRESLIGPLLDRWRDNAKVLRQCCCAREADLIERLVQDAEKYLAELDDRLLTLKEAAELSGYCASHLGRMVRNGTIPNAGRPGAPRIRAADVPRKPVAQCSSSSQIDREQIVRSAINEVE